MECAVVIDAITKDRDPDAVFDRLADFRRFPELTSSVRSVEVLEEAGSLQSTWEVNFRKGLLRWTEEDEVDKKARRIDFQQVRGDLASFTGSWAVKDTGDGEIIVQFSSKFDLGVASLAEIVDPIACSAMAEGIQQILLGLFGDGTVTEVKEAGLVAQTI